MPLFRLHPLHCAALLLPLAFGVCCADWTLTSGPGSTAGRTEAILGSGENLFAATNGGGVFRSPDQGTTWTAVNNGLGIYLAEICLASIDATLFTGAYGSGVYRSTDKGGTWAAANSGITNTNPRAFCRKGEDLFVATSGGGIFRTSNKGDSWTAASTGLTNYFVQALALSGTTLFAGNQNGAIFRSADNGDSWSEVKAAYSDNEVVGLAAVDGTIIVATKSNGVFRSANNGDTWTAANTGVNTYGTRTLIAAGNELFLGTGSEGVFHSSDKGATWTQEKTGLTDKDIQSVAVFGADAYTGTNGKVWRRPLSELGITVGLKLSPENPSASGFSPGLVSSFRSGVRIGFRLARVSHIDLSAYGMDGTKISTLAHGLLNAGEHRPTFTATGLPAGLYCFRLQIDGMAKTKLMRLD